MSEYPTRKVSPFVLPFGGGRRASAWGRSPVAPGMVPINALRSHQYPLDPAVAQEGVAEFRENMERGEPIPQLPQRMAFLWNKRQDDGSFRGPGASAAEVAAAVATAGQIYGFVAERTLTPQYPEEAEAMRNAMEILFEPGLEIEPEPITREVPGGAQLEPTSAELLDAYGERVQAVLDQGLATRGVGMAKALVEVSLQQRKFFKVLERGPFGSES